MLKIEKAFWNIFSDVGQTARISYESRTCWSSVKRECTVSTDEISIVTRDRCNRLQPFLFLFFVFSSTRKPSFSTVCSSMIAPSRSIEVHLVYYSWVGWDIRLCKHQQDNKLQTRTYPSSSSVRVYSSSISSQCHNPENEQRWCALSSKRRPKGRHSNTSPPTDGWCHPCSSFSASCSENHPTLLLYPISMCRGRLWYSEGIQSLRMPQRSALGMGIIEGNVPRSILGSIPNWGALQCQLHV